MRHALSWHRKTTMYDKIVKNGIVCTASEQAKLDIAIKDGKIAVLAGDIPPEQAKEVIDAEGGHHYPRGC